MSRARCASVKKMSGTVEARELRIGYALGCVSASLLLARLGVFQYGDLHFGQIIGSRIVGVLEGIVAALSPCARPDLDDHLMQGRSQFVNLCDRRESSIYLRLDGRWGRVSGFFQTTHRRQYFPIVGAGVEHQI